MVASLGTGNKLRTYRMFKRKFQYEQYLSWVTINKHRVALTSHKLAIETGRYLLFPLMKGFVLNVDLWKMKYIFMSLEKKCYPER